MLCPLPAMVLLVLIYLEHGIIREDPSIPL